MAFFKRHGRENTFIKILSRFPFDFCYASYVSESQDKAFYRAAKLLLHLQGDQSLGMSRLGLVESSSFVLSVSFQFICSVVLDS